MGIDLCKKVGIRNGRNLKAEKRTSQQTKVINIAFIKYNKKVQFFATFEVNFVQYYRNLMMLI